MSPASCKPDAMIAAAGHVEREYGYGYMIGLDTGVAGGGLFTVRHFDGSEFRLHADRWGNVARVPDDPEEFPAWLSARVELSRVP